MRDSRGQKFLRESSISPIVIDTLPIQAIGDLACVGLFIMQALLDYSKTCSEYIPQAPAEVGLKKLGQNARTLQTIMDNSYKSFMLDLPNVRLLNYGQRIGQSSEDVRRKLGEWHQWISIGLERLVKVLDQQPLSRDRDSFWNGCELVLGMIGYMLPQHLCSWLMLTLGEAAFVHGLIDKTYKQSANYLFDAALYHLQSLAFDVDTYKLQRYLFG